jgi:hypothetical protein
MMNSSRSLHRAVLRPSKGCVRKHRSWRGGKRLLKALPGPAVALITSYCSHMKSINSLGKIRSQVIIENKEVSVRVHKMFIGVKLWTHGVTSRSLKTITEEARGRERLIIMLLSWKLRLTTWCPLERDRIVPLITQGGEASSRSHSLNLSARVLQAGFYLRLSHLSLNIKKVLVMAFPNNH